MFPKPSSPTRRQMLATVPAFALAAQTRRKPNVIWIMADDLGIGDLGCYGQKHIKTPNVDSLARDGMRFTDAYAGCTVCAPSRSVLMTGLHMGHTPVRSNPGGVPLLENEFTVASLFKQAGYATGCFGKWGLGNIGTPGVPWKKGFDEFYGYLHQAHAHYFYPRYLWWNEKQDILPGNEKGARVTYSHDKIAERGLDFLKRNKDKPFFAYFPFTIPHLELLVPEDSRKPYRDRFPEKPYVDPRRHYADQPESRATYAGMVSRLDGDVGRILAFLKENNLEKDTLVIFTSDNGGATRLWGEDFFRSNADFRGNKQLMYEGGIRTPLLARWPGRIKPGSTSSHVCSFADFMETAAEITGQKAPAGGDGISFLPALEGRKQKTHDYLYWELPRYDGKTGTFPDEVPMQALRQGSWKAVRPKPGVPVEIYNLADDPGETKDLAAAKPEVREKLEALLKAARRPPRPQSEPPHKHWEGPDA